MLRNMYEFQKCGTVWTDNAVRLCKGKQKRAHVYKKGTSNLHGLPLRVGMFCILRIRRPIMFLHKRKTVWWLDTKTRLKSSADWIQSRWMKETKRFCWLLIWHCGQDRHILYFKGVYSVRNHFIDLHQSYFCERAKSQLTAFPKTRPQLQQGTLCPKIKGCKTCHQYQSCQLLSIQTILIEKLMFMKPWQYKPTA